LLMQIKSYCAFKKCDLELRPDLFDMAIENYFSIM